MRQILFALTLLLCASLLGCVSEKKNKIEGTWRLVSGTQKTADKTYDLSKSNYHMMKMIYENHFAFVGRYIGDADTLDTYGGGTYALEGSNWTESIDYHSHKPWIGEAMPCEMEVRNDTLIQKGPRKIGKYQDSKFELYEVYVRMK